MFPMYRNKRQSAYKTHENNLVLGPRRRRDIEPHEGEANVDANAVAAAIEDMDEDDSYEAPAVPSKAQGPVKNDEDNVISEDKLAEQKLLPAVPKSKQNEANKSQVKQSEDEEKLINPVPNNSAAIAQDSSALSSSNENSMQNAFCNNMVLPLTKTVVDGVNYYNMSVSDKTHPEDRM